MTIRRATYLATLSFFLLVSVPRSSASFYTTDIVLHNPCRVATLSLSLVSGADTAGNPFIFASLYGPYR